MSRLEACYLANVVLYFKGDRNLKDVIKLKRVNKKCQEATLIIRYYDWNACDTMFGIFPNIETMFDIFPNIETIKCSSQSLNKNKGLEDKIKLIELEDTKEELAENIGNKVVKLTVNGGAYTLKDSQIAQKIIVYLHLTVLEEEENYTYVEYNSESCGYELDVTELKSFATIFSSTILFGVDDDYYLNVKNGVKIYNFNGSIDSKFYNKYLFTLCMCHRCDVDLNNCWYLTELHFDGSVCIGNCTNLKVIGVRGYFDEIPPSVKIVHLCGSRQVSNFVYMLKDLPEPPNFLLDFDVSDTLDSSIEDFLEEHHGYTRYSD